MYEAGIGRGVDCAICPSTTPAITLDAGPPSICAFSSPPADVSQLVHGWLFLPILPPLSPPRNGARPLPATRRRGTASILSCPAVPPEVDSHPFAPAVFACLLNRNSLPTSQGHERVHGVGRILRLMLAASLHTSSIPVSSSISWPPPKRPQASKPVALLRSVRACCHSLFPTIPLPDRYILGSHLPNRTAATRSFGNIHLGHLTPKGLQHAIPGGPLLGQSLGHQASR